MKLARNSNSLLFLFIFGDWDREIRDVISEKLTMEFDDSNIIEN